MLPSSTKSAFRVPPAGSQHPAPLASLHLVTASLWFSPYHQSCEAKQCSCSVSKEIQLLKAKGHFSSNALAELCWILQPIWESSWCT